MNGARLAVMEDDTVLCTDCVHEHQREGLPETAATIVPRLAGGWRWRGVSELRRHRQQRDGRMSAGVLPDAATLDGLIARAGDPKRERWL